MAQRYIEEVVVVRVGMVHTGGPSGVVVVVNIILEILLLHEAYTLVIVSRVMLFHLHTWIAAIAGRSSGANR